PCRPGRSTRGSGSPADNRCGRTGYRSPCSGRPGSAGSRARTFPRRPLSSPAAAAEPGAGRAAPAWCASEIPADQPRAASILSPLNNSPTSRPRVTSATCGRCLSPLDSPQASRPRVTSATCGLHDRFVDILPGLLGLGDGEQNLLVFARHDLHEVIHLLGPIAQDAIGDRGAGLVAVLGDGVAQPGEVVTDQLLERLALVRADLGDEGALRVVDERHATGHAGAEVAPGRPEDHHAAAGHVLAAVVAHAFDD